MKRLFLLAMLVLVNGVFGAVINTYDPDSSQLSWWNVYGNGAPAVQHFTILEGQTCTKVEVLVEKGAATNSSYDAQLQVFDSSNNYLGGGSLSADQFTSSRDWVAVDGLSLSSGSYYVQVFTNDSGFKGYLHTRFDASDAYNGGYAANGWSGGTEISPAGDFAGRLTVVPEPTMIVLLGVGSLILRRKRKIC